MSFSEPSIKVQVYQAIKPVLDKADALLDYYLADAPVEVWKPIAQELDPRIGFIRLGSKGKNKLAFVLHYRGDCEECNAQLRSHDNYPSLL